MGRKGRREKRLRGEGREEERMRDGIEGKRGGDEETGEEGRRRLREGGTGGYKNENNNSITYLPANACGIHRYRGICMPVIRYNTLFYTPPLH